MVGSVDVNKQLYGGFKWSFIESFSTKTVSFVIGIILARLLSPDDYGLMGMMSVIIAFSSILVNSGLNQSLIRKSDCNEEDLATVFYFNIVFSLFLYTIIYLFSSHISIFFDRVELELLLKVFSLVLVVNSFSIVQTTLLMKQLQFRSLTYAYLTAALFSGIVGIVMALSGFGVWSLVAQQISLNLVSNAILWYRSDWTPTGKFSREHLRKLYGFSGNLTILAVIDAIYINMYNVIIGKFYNAALLGVYTRAVSIKKISAESLGSMIDRVTFPTFSAVQNNAIEYIRVYKKVLSGTALLAFLSLFGLSALSKELVHVLLGSEWTVAGEYLAIISIAGVSIPINKVNSSVIKVAGRSDQLLIIGIMLKVTLTGILFVGVFVSIKAMLYASILQSAISIILIMSVIPKHISVTFKEQLHIILKPLLISSVMAASLVLLGDFVEASHLMVLMLKTLSAVLYLLLISKLFHIQEFAYMAKLVKGKLSK
jgi:teichuronic acid exporter